MQIIDVTYYAARWGEDQGAKIKWVFLGSIAISPPNGHLLEKNPEVEHHQRRICRWTEFMPYFEPFMYSILKVSILSPSVSLAWLLLRLSTSSGDLIICVCWFVPVSSVLGPGVMMDVTVLFLSNLPLSFCCLMCFLVSQWWCRSTMVVCVALNLTTYGIHKAAWALTLFNNFAEWHLELKFACADKTIVAVVVGIVVISLFHLFFVVRIFVLLLLLWCCCCGVAVVVVGCASHRWCKEMRLQCFKICINLLFQVDVADFRTA